MARTTINLRKALETAAGESGRSLAQEVEARLDQSFREPELRNSLVAQETHRFGGEKTARLIREIVAVIASIGGDHNSAKEPLVREALKAGIDTILNARLPGWDAATMRAIGINPLRDEDLVHHPDREAVDRWRTREAMLAQIVLLNTEDKEYATSLPGSNGQDPAASLFEREEHLISVEKPRRGVGKGAAK